MGNFNRGIKTLRAIKSILKYLKLGMHWMGLISD